MLASRVPVSSSTPPKLWAKAAICLALCCAECSLLPTCTAILLIYVAARLQDMTKSLACEVVISDEVRATAGLAADLLPQHEVAIRGRNEPMIVRSVTDAKTLTALVDTVKAAAA